MKPSRDMLLRVFFYVSLGCLAAYLYASGILDFRPHAFRWEMCVLAMLFGVLGFGADTYMWHVILRIFDRSVRLRASFHSAGISVFAKYIPGKIWVAVSRAMAVSRHGIDIEQAATASIIAQFVQVCTGMIIGSVFLVSTAEAAGMRISAACCAAAFAFPLLFRPVLDKGADLIGKLLKRDVRLPACSCAAMLRITGFSLLSWLLWGAGFYVLSEGMAYLPDTPVALIFVFPLSAVIGIIVLFAPGGLGAREGAMTVMLVFAGFPAGNAAALSTAARAWFLAAETLFFLSALSLSPFFARKAEIQM